MKRIISILVVLTILSTTVLASSDIKDQISKTNNEIDSKKSELAGVQKDKKLTLNDIDSLDRQIGSTETEIRNLESDIKTLEQNILIAEQNIAYSEKQYEKKEETREDRLVAHYKAGTLSFWDMLFSADSLTDFFYRYRLMQKVNEYDKELLEEIQKDKAEIESQKVALEDNKVVCEDKKVAAEEKKQQLSETKEVRVSYLAKLEQTEDLLSDSIDALQKKANELEAELRRIASSSSTSTYTGGSMAWPLPGFYTITSPFGNRLHPILKVYKLHTGVDIAGGGCNGKNVVAAADGKVINSGWLSGYGYTVMIDHGGGIVTLYAHSQKLLVSVGQQVKRGDPIMLVGSTGYATGPHLHFEVRVDGKYVNPVDGYISAK